MDEALKILLSFRCDYLVVSAGMDLCKHDPLGTFKVTGQGIRKIGARLREIAEPTLIVMEGGYDHASLGTTVVSLLENFA